MLESLTDFQKNLLLISLIVIFVILVCYCMKSVKQYRHYGKSNGYKKYKCYEMKPKENYIPDSYTAGTWGKDIEQEPHLVNNQPISQLGYERTILPDNWKTLSNKDKENFFVQRKALHTSLSSDGNEGFTSVASDLTGKAREGFTPMTTRDRYSMDTGEFRPDLIRTMWNQVGYLPKKKENFVDSNTVKLRDRPPKEGPTSWNTHKQYTCNSGNCSRKTHKPVSRKNVAFAPINDIELPKLNPEAITKLQTNDMRDYLYSYIDNGGSLSYAKINKRSDIPEMARPDLIESLENIMDKEG